MGGVDAAAGRCRRFFANKIMPVSAGIIAEKIPAFCVLPFLLQKQPVRTSTCGLSPNGPRGPIKELEGGSL